MYSMERFIEEYRDYIIYLDDFEYGVDYIIRFKGEFIKYTFNREKEFMYRSVVSAREVFDSFHSGERLLLLVFNIIKIETLSVLFLMALYKAFCASKEKLYDVFCNSSMLNILLLLTVVYCMIRFADRRGIYGRGIIKNYFNIALSISVGMICVKLGDYDTTLKFVVIVLFSLFALSSTAYFCGKLRLEDYYGEFKKRFSV